MHGEVPLVLNVHSPPRFTQRVGANVLSRKDAISSKFEPIYKNTYYSVFIMNN